jgi:hypothetical protein
VDPAHSLSSWPDAPSQAEFHERSQSRECPAPCAAISPDYKTSSQDYLALRREDARAEFIFPRSADKWGKAAAKRRVFGAGDRWRVAIDVGRAHLHPHGRRIVDRPDRQAEGVRRFDSRSQDLVLMIGSFDAIDATPDQVHQARRAIELPPPFASGSGIPTDPPPAPLGPRWMAGKDYDRSVVVCKMYRQRDP